MSKEKLEKLYQLLDEYSDTLVEKRPSTLRLVLKIKDIISYELSI